MFSDMLLLNTCLKKEGKWVFSLILCSSDSMSYKEIDIRKMNCGRIPSHKINNIFPPRLRYLNLINSIASGRNVNLMFLLRP
jgi:hypothetical protein